MSGYLPDDTTHGMADCDPRLNPCAGDIFKRWEQTWLVLQVTQGCVYTRPPLSAHKEWAGILFFREWAKNSEVVFAANRGLEI